MIGPLARDSSIFYAALGAQAFLIKNDVLDGVDALLDDDELVNMVKERLASRSPRSAKAGREGMAPDRLLRCCALKHMKQWSFRTLERELRGNIKYRQFTRYYEGKIPDYSVLSRSFALLGQEVTRAIHERIVGKAEEARIAPGNKLRTDTTVVETNVHYPTDSSLLWDGVRVLTRGLRRLADECDAGALKVVNHARAVKYRLLEICRAAKNLNEAGQERLKTGYTKLLEIGARVMRQTIDVIDRLTGSAGEKLRVIGDPRRIVAAQASLEHFAPLVQRVINQTKERVFGGNRHVADKVLSIFETSTAAIRKGKAHKPTEFGRLVRLDEVENGIVSGYEVQVGNQADTDSWDPAISQHAVRYGSAPRLATGDRGFFSAANEKSAHEKGVRKVALPARGKLSEKRKKLQKQRWFRRALRWRAGIEARISNLKHVFGMARARYKGDAGFERHVGWSVIANNLVALARGLIRRKERQRENGKR